VRKSEDKMRQERSRLDMYKIEISGDSAERGKKKREENKKRVRKEWKQLRNMIIFMQRGVRLIMFIFLTCL
jgi:hypothetical protein